ncbi:lipocalin family protein [uncultured Tenacibaculum sp.]|uniref:lipocalin family protein n=1 Tax=uncultured Tenacibaculum sp. TaxID=174713 RepID=UPI00261557C5|nr:lipocalin family protein [uncultured Tenacibaculum sp.]
MNKLCYTLLFLVLFISCSSDSDDNNNVNDPILGTWNLFSSGGSEATDCEKQSTITFASNKTTSSETFQDLAGNCISLTGNDTWENKGDNVYSFNNLESQIEFSNDNMTFRIVSGNIVYQKQ